MLHRLIIVALLLVLPAAYAWWSGRKVLRSLDDPALVDLLQAHRRRMATVAVTVTGAVALTGTFLWVAGLVLVALVAAQYPLRRAVYGEEWSIVQYVAYSVASFVGAFGMQLFALAGPTASAHLVRDWIPGPTRASYDLALVLGVVCAIIFVAWRRWFTTIWLWLHRASPLERDAAHAPLLPRLDAVLDRAGDRLGRRPSIHRYGVKGGLIPNAFALPSLHEPAVAIGDTLLDTLDADETTAIFAHEIAHHEYFDGMRLSVQRRWLILLAVLIALMPALLLAVGIDHDFSVSLVFLFVLASLLVRGQAPKQEQETASDLRAVELTNDPDALIRALTKIHVLARQPRRWEKKAERAMTHPSLARRIQAIRASAPAASAPLDSPTTIIAAATTGSFVVLERTHAYWFDGVPADTQADLASLRERASSYRVMTYRELSDLRLVATHGQRALRATDLAGRSWSVDVREADVAAIENALDAVDSQLGARRVEPVMQRDNTARTVAAALLIAVLLGGGTTAVVIPALATLLAPTTTSLAALGAMGTTCLLLLGTNGAYGVPREMGVVLVASAIGLGAAWLAWTWYRARREPTAPAARLGVGLMFALLALGALTTLLMVSSMWTSARDLAADENALSLAITVCGLGAAMLTLRTTALRLAGAGAAVLGVVALGAVTLAERVWPAASEIGWGNGGLALVATVPLPHDMDAVTLSPAGTRYLTRRSLAQDGDDESATSQFTTGDVARAAEPYTVNALDAALPNETEMLVLAPRGDSLELWLEDVNADQDNRIVWRLPLGALYAPTLRLLDGGKQWQVSGMRVGERGVSALVTLDGAVDGRVADLHHTELTADQLPGQSVFTYRDGSRLVLTLGRNPMLAMGNRSVLWSTLVALRGINMSWQLSRQDHDGVHPLATLHGPVRCWPATEDDVAVCADQSVRGVHVMSVAHSGQAVDLGMLARRYQRATASPQGQLVASSYADHSLAVIDVVHRRGLRIVLPPSNASIIRDATATGDAVAVLLSEKGRPRLVVYRLGPLLQTAMMTGTNRATRP